VEYVLVVGDVVSGLGNDNAIFEFQPAAGVEVALKTTWSGTGSARSPHLRDVTNFSAELQTDMSAAATGYQNLLGTMFITNTLYIRIGPSVGNRNAYSGIQIA